MLNRSSSTSSFKQFGIKFILPFVLLFIVPGYAFQYIFERNIILKTPIGGAYKVNRIINEFHPNEIAMFGSSRMVEGLIPDVLGPNYYNYGVNGTRDNVALFFLEEEMRKNKRTPVIFNLDIYGLNTGSGDFLNYLYNIDYKPVQDLIRDKEQLYHHIPFAKYYGKYEYYLKDFLSSRITITKYTSNGASIEKNALLPANFSALVNERENTAITFINEPALLAKLINLIRSNQARKFIFVAAPCHPSCFKRFTNPADLLRFYDSLRTFKNVRVFNFNKAPFADSLFFDTMHLNYKGALKYSNMLKDSIAML